MNLTPEKKALIDPEEHTDNGLHGDYWNKIVVIGNAYRLGKRNGGSEQAGLTAIVELLQQEPIIYYEEHFTREELDAHVNSDNQPIIDQINIIVDGLNGSASNGTLSLKQVEEAWNQLGILISGGDYYSKWS